MYGLLLLLLPSAAVSLSLPSGSGGVLRFTPLKNDEHPCVAENLKVCVSLAYRHFFLGLAEFLSVQ